MLESVSIIGVYLRCIDCKQCWVLQDELICEQDSTKRLIVSNVRVDHEEECIQQV